MYIVHAHKKLVCAANISTVHDRILLKFKIAIDNLTFLDEDMQTQKKEMTSPKNYDDFTQKDEGNLTPFMGELSKPALHRS